MDLLHSRTTALAWRFLNAGLESSGDDAGRALLRDYAVYLFFQAEDGIRYVAVTGVQTCALPIFTPSRCRTSGGPVATSRPSSWRPIAWPTSGRAAPGRRRPCSCGTAWCSKAAT